MAIFPHNKLKDVKINDIISILFFNKKILLPKKIIFTNYTSVTKKYVIQHWSLKANNPIATL